TAAKFGQAEAGLEDRVGRIDDNAAIPAWQIGHRRLQVLPGHAEKDDVGGGSLTHGASAGLCAELPNDFGERRRTAAIAERAVHAGADRKSTRLNSSHVSISYAVFCLKKKTDK